MEQQSQSESQEPIQLGEADLTTEGYVINDLQNDSQSSIAQESSPSIRTQQGTPNIVNYGPCVKCKTNERCVLFIGCNHLACCGRCSTNCNGICPVANCNQSIIECLHVFKP